MGIDVFLYVWEAGDDYPNTACLKRVPEVDLREAYFRNNIYATRILFEEAWNENHPTLMLYDIRPKQGVLKSRLPKALEAIEERIRNLPGNNSTEELKEYEQEEKERFTKFVERYEEENESGNTPIISVSY